MMAVHNDQSAQAAQVLREKLARDPEAFAIVVAGPSGVGKTTLCRRVLALEPDIRRCATTTTRPPRDDEVEGVERHFVSEAAFRQMLDRGAFVEYAEVHAYLYGATLDAVFTALSGGHVVLMDVDVQGVKTWKRVLAERCVTAFVLPPSLDALASRLIERQSETQEAFHLRMENAVGELRQAGDYEYLIVNDDLDRAVEDLRAIIRAERNRTGRVRRRLSDLGLEA